MLLAGKLRPWKNALLIVKPETLLRWHRSGFRLFWKMMSRATSRSPKPKLPAKTITLIKQIAQENRLWGAERIRGELLKLNIREAKRTIQKYMHQAREPAPAERKPAGPNWSTFLHNYAAQTYSCDFIQVYDLFFRPLFIFFIIELGSRRVMHFRGVRAHLFINRRNWRNSHYRSWKCCSRKSPCKFPPHWSAPNWCIRAVAHTAFDYAFLIDQSGSMSEQG